MTNLSIDELIDEMVSAAGDEVAELEFGSISKETHKRYEELRAKLDARMIMQQNKIVELEHKLALFDESNNELLVRIAELERIADMLELTGDMLTMNPECSDIDKRERAWNKAVEDWNEYKRRQHDPSN